MTDGMNFINFFHLGNYGSSIAILSVLIELELLKNASDTKCTKQLVRQCIVCKCTRLNLIVEAIN